VYSTRSIRIGGGVAGVRGNALFRANGLGVRVSREVGKLARRGRARVRLALLWCCQEQSTASKLRAAGAGSWKAVPGFWKLVLVVRDGHSDRAFGSQQGEIDC
ncbi:MAG: hypothetical protein MK364_01745, partial [Pirellulales bacterium]|nr:hypothetical protein [Pirellulales bacterium]